MSNLDLFFLLIYYAPFSKLWYMLLGLVVIACIHFFWCSLWNKQYWYHSSAISVSLVAWIAVSSVIVSTSVAKDIVGDRASTILSSKLDFPPSGRLKTILVNLSSTKNPKNEQELFTCYAQYVYNRQVKQDSAFPQLFDITTFSPPNKNEISQLTGDILQSFILSGEYTSDIVVSPKAYFRFNNDCKSYLVRLQKESNKKDFQEWALSPGPKILLIALIYLPTMAILGYKDIKLIRPL